MEQWLISPGGWTAPLSVMGAIIALIGAMMLDQVRSAVAGFQRAPSAWSVNRRIIAGHIAAAPLSALALAAAMQAQESSARALWGAVALLLYLALGWTLPRRELVRAQQKRKRIRSLIPSFISFLRTALIGPDSRPMILRRYAQRDDRRLQPMQEVALAALSLVETRNRLPFEALLEVARDVGVPELVDVALVLAQAEKQGSNPIPVLEQIETLITQILQDEFRQVIEKRKLYLLALGALSVVGILIQILFVIVVGGGVLERF